MLHYSTFDIYAPEGHHVAGGSPREIKIGDEVETALGKGNIAAIHEEYGTVEVDFHGAQPSQFRTSEIVFLDRK